MDKTKRLLSDLVERLLRELLNNAIPNLPKDRSLRLSRLLLNRSMEQVECWRKALAIEAEARP